MKRKVCVITGTRADYGILTSVMRAIDASAHLKLQLVVTCMHLMKEFGYTIREITKEGFTIAAKIDVSYTEDTNRAMATLVGRAVIGFARAFSALKPDVVLVLGDRGEMLAATIAANYLGIPVAHIHGGEVSGHVDGIIRHAITKMAHIHLPATKQAGVRIINLGEEKWRVFVVGAPALDRISREKLPGKKQLFRKYGLTMNEPVLLVVQHPVSTQEDQAGEQMHNTLDAVKGFGLQTVIIYPNADAGGRKMRKVIEQYAALPNIKTYKNIPHKDYLALLKHAAVLVGNSSSGIIEAPSFGLPVVNIGIRQQGRERGSNVIDVPHNINAISAAIRKALNDNVFLARIRKSKNPYGDGQASRRIIKVLKNIPLNKRLLQKQIQF